MNTKNATPQQVAIADTEYAETMNEVSPGNEGNGELLDLFQELSNFQYEDMASALFLERLKPELLRRMTR